MSDKANIPKYVFGPVPSRRLGRSLGIDLVSYKTCTFDEVAKHLAHLTRTGAIRYRMYQHHCYYEVATVR